MGAAVGPKCGLLAAIILFVFLKSVFLIPVELAYSVVVVSGVRSNDPTLLYTTAIIFNVSDRFFSSSGHSVILLP